MLLDQILLHVPCPIFWKNTKGEFLGCNKLFLEIAGFEDYSQLIGKVDNDLSWKQYRSEYNEDDMYVITTGNTLTRIENIPLRGRMIISETTKTPLIQDGKIIGVLGICLDITDKKEKERLELENQEHIAEQKIHQQFRRIVDQVAHDIRSPAASLNMLVSSCGDIKEKDRVPIRRAITRVNEIANNLLSYFKLQNNLETEVAEVQDSLPLLVSADLLEIITEKKYEYARLPIDFIDNFNNSCHFAFINAKSQNFKRSISNLINNAVDAFDGKPGVVTVYLEANYDEVKVIIEDNGKGMPDVVVNKIMSAVNVTYGKSGGYGIGFEQVRDMIAQGNGKLFIKSTVGVGTKIILSFPQVLAPNWIAERIELDKDDLVIILDDELSIHDAWESKFKHFAPRIKKQHFKNGAVAVEFLNQLSPEEKDRTFLLTDYELLKQGLNGLNVVDKTQIKRSILVTSHYNNNAVRKLAALTGTKILPKQLASEVRISVCS